MRRLGSLSPATDPAPTMNQNETDNSPVNAAEHAEEEAWSGEDDVSDNDGADASGKRKRQRLSRPLSVSCELCKSRKVGLPFHLYYQIQCTVRWEEVMRSLIASEPELTIKNR
jgi:hypothetical protein